MNQVAAALAIGILATASLVGVLYFSNSLPTSSSSSTTSSSSTGNPYDLDLPLTTYLLPYTFASNWGTAGAAPPIYIQSPRTIQINMIDFDMVDRNYDPNNITVYFQTMNGQTLATGNLTEWGPYGMTGEFGNPIPLSQIVTMQANIQYQITTSRLPLTDTYGCNVCTGITADLISEGSSPGVSYLGQSRWPMLSLGLMKLNPEGSGLAHHNYNSMTDLEDSPGINKLGAPNNELAIRFKVSKPEQLTGFEVLAIDSTASNNALVFTLRNDCGCTYSHPSSTILSTGSVTIASVASSLRPDPASPSGKSSFINVDLPSPPLTVGQFYWIVIASPTGDQGVTLARLVNPYRNYLLVSGNDFQTSWSVPLDGPTDISYRISTTNENIINTITGGPKFNYFVKVAQSFIPSVTSQVKGVWIKVNGTGREMYASIQSDSGNDSPSGNALIKGRVNPVGAPWMLPVYGNNYISFGGAVTLNSGTKYWLVIEQTSCLTLCSGPNSIAGALEYRSDYYNTPNDFGGSAIHFEYIPAGGTNWITDSNLGDISFVLASPTSLG